MVLTPDKPIIRFGLGTAGIPSSALWRMWVRGDETYLGVRTALGLSKVSLHSTGHWALAAGTGRVSINGPRLLNGEWKAGPRVVFPGVPPLTPLGPFEQRIAKSAFLFAAPDLGHWRDFVVLFGAPSARPDDVIKKLPSGSDLVGPIFHRCGDVAWLATFLAPMTNEQVEYIRAERNKFRLTVQGNLDSLPGAVAILVQDAANGDTMLINVDLGRENIALVEQ